MVEAGDVFAAMDWAWVYIFPPASVIALLMQVVNLYVLYKGRKSERLTDPVYILWIAYGCSDITALIAYIIDLGTDGPITFKWIAWLDWTFGWYPALYLQTVIAIYYCVVLSCPVWYFQNSDGPKLRNMVRGSVVFVYSCSFLLCFPLMLPGISVCYCPEGSEFTDKMNEIYFIYSYMNQACVLAPLLCYCFLAVQLCVSSRAKVGEDAWEGQSENVKKKRVKRMLKIAFISWSITAISMLSYDIDYYAQGSPLFEVIMYVVINASYVIHISATPFIQVVRNSNYRQELGRAFGCVGNENMVTKLVTKTQNK